MNNQQDIRALFLKEFIKRLIMKSAPLHLVIAKKEEKKLIEAKPKIEISEKAVQKVEPKPAQPIPVPAPFIPSAQVAAPPMPIPAVSPMPPRAPFIPSAQPAVPQVLTPKVIEMSPFPAEQKPLSLAVQPGMPVFDKLRPWIDDTTIQLINCPGPDKNILITRFGAVQATPLALSTDEINNFIKEISEKTRIPLLPGIFKVAYQNFILTAVVSEFLGTKFIIEKRPLAYSPALPIRAPVRF